MADHPGSRRSDVVRLGAPGVEHSNGHHTINAEIEFRGKPARLRYAFLGAEPEMRGDALIPAVLLAAMAFAAPIASETPVSRQLLNQLEGIEEIYATWVPRLKKVRVSSPREERAIPPGTKTAAFFTGGLDSYYTLLSHQAEIDYLVFVHGLASPMAGTERSRASSTLQRAAAGFGKPLIEVETNLAHLLDEWLEPKVRGHLSPRLTNFELAHGAALASVAHFLPASIGRVYIAATYTYNDLFPWGSHPLLDPLWSTERLTIRHDGCGATRVDKARVIGEWPLALDTLRVCPEGGTAHALNCGRCEKCLRTMVNLRIVGALDDCRAFAEPLDLRRIALLREPPFKPFLRENLAAAQVLGTDPDLIRALELAVHPWRPKRLALEVGLRSWKAIKRFLPVEYASGRVRWR